MTTRLIRLFMCSLFCCAMLSTAHASSIGINFTGTAFGGGPYPILSAESAGLVPQTNWNNSLSKSNGTTQQIAGPVAGELVNNLGAISGAQVVWAGGNSNVNSNGGNTTPDERLYRGVLEGQGLNANYNLSVTVFNIPYPKYEVIAYLQGFGFAAEASVRLRNEEYYYIQSSNFTTDGFIQATATTYADRKLATYAIFDNQTSNFFTLDMITRGGNRVGIAGVQIVQLPEPSSLVLSAIGGAAAFAFFQRRRSGRANP